MVSPDTIFNGRKMTLLFAAVALASINSATAFVPLTKKTALPARVVQLKKAHSSSTALSISWPGQDDKNEAEGKRDTDSRLQSSAAESGEVSLFFDAASTTKSFEEFVAPLSTQVDDLTGGWALSYASLAPETETTPIGMSFLATNVAYGMAGLLVSSQGNALLGVLTEFACLASFTYHYAQLKLGEEGSRIVRLTLLVDYVFALTAILVGSGQMLLAHQLPTEALYSGSLAITCLGLCWVRERGLFYIIFHSLWHLFSAYTAYVIGTTC